ncbi:hypothetical protein BH09PAT4_BH09PAT4_07460 [soil metagenome]
MVNSSTVGEHITSWCPYSGFALAADSIQPQEARASSPTVLEDLNEMPCAFVQDGICVLAAYSVKKTLGLDSSDTA